MKPLSDKNKLKLQQRTATNALRSLGAESNSVDFSSNDYLGFSKSSKIFDTAHNYLVENNLKQNGATGSRLLSGNHKLYDEVESMLCKFHESETALIFNSGYDVNIGFFSSVPQRGDIILYDELIHASIRDGIAMSHAKSYKFKHNDIDNLKSHLERSRKVPDENEVYVVTESVFSMDGDTPDVRSIAELCTKYNAYFIVDEAHAIGVFGENGCGIVQELGIQDAIFARIITFGKALGCHGAAILGGDALKQYLVNFARSFIYTTGLPPHSLATIKTAYNVILSDSEESQIKQLKENIQFFNSELKRLKFNTFPFGEILKGQWGFIQSTSAIHCCIISGNEKVKPIALKLQENGFNVKPILSPTVPEGQERLRFCIHAYNTMTEISMLLSTLKESLNKFPSPLERD